MFKTFNLNAVWEETVEQFIMKSKSKSKSVQTNFKLLLISQKLWISDCSFEFVDWLTQGIKQGDKEMLNIASGSHDVT